MERRDEGINQSVSQTTKIADPFDKLRVLDPEEEIPIPPNFSADLADQFTDKDLRWFSSVSAFIREISGVCSWSLILFCVRFLLFRSRDNSWLRAHLVSSLHLSPRAGVRMSDDRIVGLGSVPSGIDLRFAL